MQSLSLRRAQAAILVFLVSIATLGCAGREARPIDLPAPVEVNSLGPGDVFQVHIVGEDKLPTEYTVAPDGTVDLPYIARVKVEGLEPQEVAAEVRRKLVEGEILSDPSVSVSIKEYNSKRIAVLGEVAKPGSFPMEPGMTLLRAISLAGGFTRLADKNNVTIRRKVENGTKAATVSVDDIIDNLIPDVALQAGDSINIDDKVF